MRLIHAQLPDHLRYSFLPSSERMATLHSALFGGAGIKVGGEPKVDSFGCGATLRRKPPRFRQEVGPLRWPIVAAFWGRAGFPPPTRHDEPNVTGLEKLFGTAQHVHLIA
jgi:hypothetical protein